MTVKKLLLSFRTVVLLWSSQGHSGGGGGGGAVAAAFQMMPSATTRSVFVAKQHPLRDTGSIIGTCTPPPLYFSTKEEEGFTTMMATTSTTGAAATTALVAAKMDEGIFNFNKAVIDTFYDLICLIYPVTGGKRDYARFFVLETVARVPYFAYLSVLHLRETFGVRDNEERMRTHYAEADNELHHLLIMEALGGNASSLDRFLAQTTAFFYYWYVVFVYMISEQAAYHLSELIEDHAYETYDNFLTQHETMLKAQPVPDIARKYYERDNPFLFDLFCTVKDDDEMTRMTAAAASNGAAASATFSARRPKLNSLYDVFVNIRDDEKEHWKTLCNLVQYNDMQAVSNQKVKSTEPATTATTTTALSLEA